MNWFKTETSACKLYWFCFGKDERKNKENWKKGERIEGRIQRGDIIDRKKKRKKDERKSKDKEWIKEGKEKRNEWINKKISYKMKARKDEGKKEIAKEWVGRKMKERIFRIKNGE